MSIVCTPFGTTAAGEKIEQYTVTNDTGASFTAITYGAMVTSICVPDRDGKLVDVCIGFDKAEDATADHNGSAGVIVGRVGNRIANAKFSLEGGDYVLAANNGVNNLHSGPVGMGKRVWTAEAVEPATLIFRLTSEDGDQGFPGNLETEVAYMFDNNNTLTIHYFATTDKTTLCNLTNHAYFNLNGHDSGDILDHELQINAGHVNEVTMDLIPTGKLLAQDEVPFNFSKASVIRDVIANEGKDEVFDALKGCDFNYCAGADRETKTIATLYSPKTGIQMDVVTDQPGVQCYMGMGLNMPGKNGVHYGPYAGVALETQHYPDSIHQPQFPTVVLRPQDVYDSFTAYAFSVRK